MQALPRGFGAKYAHSVAAHAGAGRRQGSYASSIRAIAGYLTARSIIFVNMRSFTFNLIKYYHTTLVKTCSRDIQIYLAFIIK
jgi:hypothetical protein